MKHIKVDMPQPIDRLLARGAADATAYTDRNGSLTYRELDELAGRLAAFLRAQGLNPGDRVATWLNKTRTACVMPLAAARAGLVHVPVNALLKHAQVAHILSDSGARLLISNAERLVTLAGADIPAECALLDETALAPEAHEPIAASSANHADIAAILYTSGSTGRPKGVVLSHANLWLGAMSVSHYLDLRASDRTLCVLPLSFDYGQNQLFSTWAAGGTVIPLDYIVPKDVIRAVERFEISVLAGVPPLWSQLAAGNWPEGVAGRLRVITNSGGRLPVPLIRTMRTLFDGAALHSMYGLTEAFRSTTLDPTLVDSHPESIGTAIPHAEILVVRPDGTLTDDEEPGELVHAGPLVAQGYWRDPERTALRFKPAPPASTLGGMAVWSGDTVVRGADGLLRFVGRYDEMIKTSGNRVSPTEIEEAAMASGLVREAAVWGIADDMLGQAIMLAVAGDAANDAALKAYLRQELPNFMQPREILWRDSLPRNPNGKFDYHAIRALDVPAAQPPVPAEGTTILEEVRDLLRLERVDPALSFLDLGGDSLNYVHFVMILERHLGTLPDGWEEMPIAQLDAIARQHATSASPDAKRQAMRLPADISIRVFAMLLVVATHCSYNYHWSPAGRTFFGLFIQNATILFVFVAGMLFKRFAERASYGRYLKQRAKAVMLPYLFMSLPAIAIAIWAPLSTSHLWLHAWPWWEQAGYLLLTGEHLVQMWFMPVMILLILAAPLFRFIDRRHLYWIALPPAFLAATILGRSFAYGFTGVLGMTLHMTPAFLAGMLFERYRSPVEGWCERHLWLLVAAVAAVSAAIVADWDATLNLHLAQKLLLVPLLLILIRKFPPGPRLSALAARLAEVSFAVYLAHYYVLTAFRLGYRSLVLPQLGPGMQALGDSVPGFFLLTAIVLLGTLAAIGAARKLLGRHSRTIIGA